VDAIGWGLVGSAWFLLGTLLAGFAVPADRKTPLPIWAVTVAVLLQATGVTWAFLWTVAVGF
jgi:hypothetical protein